jgi:hypothetical protein
MSGDGKRCDGQIGLTRFDLATTSPITSWPRRRPPKQPSDEDRQSSKINLQHSHFLNCALRNPDLAWVAAAMLRVLRTTRP